MPIPECDAKVAIRLATAVVHLQEFTDPGGAPEDKQAAMTALDDPEVREYLEALDAQALLPLRRS
jgi:hypothetical protein